MKTTRYILCLAAAALLAGGCGKFVRDELITMQNEIDQLHKQVADMNEAMVSLRAIVNEMAAGGYVVEVKEFAGEDGRGGYTLVFNDGSLMSLYSGVDGRDGQDAVPPVIGLQQDAEDGEWYWTLDGEWILSPEGDRFKAVGVDGITPQLDVRQSEDVDEMHWFVSMDDGETWEDTGYKAKGEDAVEVFSAIEVLDIKKSIFKELDEICKPETILASNTSSISITAIAAATKRPEKVLGMHFFNPAPAMKLVEVIRGARTNDETFKTVYDCAAEVGKSPVEVGEAPGFVVNRILFPMINEAIMVLENGIASKEDIDTGMRFGANHPMGPLALADLVGLDICLAIMETIFTETGDSKYRPALTMKKMVRAGLLGRKTGEGFYKY